MKQKVLGGLLVVIILLESVSLLTRFKTPSNDPEYLVDLLVDAGIEFHTSPIEVSLLEHRKIVLATDINATSAQRVIRELLLLDAMDSNAPIDLYIQTQGGWITAAFSIIDTIQNLKAPVNTHAIGAAYSAGAMILAAGTGTRYAHPLSAVMFHAGLPSEDDSSYCEDALDAERLVTFWERYARIPSDWLHSEKDRTYFLKPQKALELGIVDQICAGRTDPNVPSSRLP